MGHLAQVPASLQAAGASLLELRTRRATDSTLDQNSRASSVSFFLIQVIAAPSVLLLPVGETCPVALCISSQILRQRVPLSANRKTERAVPESRRSLFESRWCARSVS